MLYAIAFYLIACRYAGKNTFEEDKFRLLEKTGVKEAELDQLINEIETALLNF